MLTDTPQWVAVYTTSRCERKAAESLTKLGIENYLPVQTVLRRWSDRWKKVEMPLFPSYLFARIRRNQVVTVRSAASVVTIISWRYEPAVIPDAQIEAIRTLMEATAKVNVVNNDRLKMGAMVRIKAGQFTGMQGVLISDCQDGNFGISITGLDFALVMDISKDVLEPIEDIDTRPKGIWEQ